MSVIKSLETWKDTNAKVLLPSHYVTYINLLLDHITILNRKFWVLTDWITFSPDLIRHLRYFTFTVFVPHLRHKAMDLCFQLTSVLPIRQCDVNVHKLLLVWVTFHRVIWPGIHVFVVEIYLKTVNVSSCFLFLNHVVVFKWLRFVHYCFCIVIPCNLNRWPVAVVFFYCNLL